jgi:hypothetical protein
MASDLEPIIQYKMTHDEAIAYKISLIWVELCKKEFPNYRHAKLRKGDPRKSLLFRYCYTLYQETKGIIPSNEYRLYVLAQLRTLKFIRCGDVHALIEPSILTGRHAWWRWKAWKRKYDKNIEYSETAEEAAIYAPEHVVVQELGTTYDWLTQQGVDSKEKLVAAVQDGRFRRWLETQRVSPYYLCVSPWANSLDNLEQVVYLDLQVYKRAINNNIRDFFKAEFGREFNERKDS